MCSTSIYISSNFKIYFSLLFSVFSLHLCIFIYRQMLSLLLILRLLLLQCAYLQCEIFLHKYEYFSYDSPKGGDSNGSSAMNEFFRDTLLCLFIEFTRIYKQNVSTCLPTICLSITIDECVCASQQKNCTETNMETIKQIKKIYWVFFSI